MADPKASGSPIGGRKVYAVEMVYYISDAPSEYNQLYEKYWSAVNANLEAMESSTGVVKHVFGEGVPGRGEDAKVALEQANPGAWRVVKERLDGGAQFELFEKDDLLAEVLDWSRCLSLGLYSRKVSDEIAANFSAADSARRAYQKQQLDELVAEGEAALLLTNSQGVPVPEGIARYIVAPPELDSIDRWIKAMRERMAQQARGAAPGAETQQQPPASDGGGGGLWTPG